MLSTVSVLVQPALDLAYSFTWYLCFVWISVPHLFLILIVFDPLWFSIQVMWTVLVQADWNIEQGFNLEKNFYCGSITDKKLKKKLKIDIHRDFEKEN